MSMNEQVNTIIQGVSRKKGLLGLRWDNYTLVITNQRLLFAMISKMCMQPLHQPESIKTTVGSGQKNMRTHALILAMLLFVCCCFQITGAGWAAALPSSQAQEAQAGRLQLEGTRLQLKRDIAGAVKKYRASLALKPDAQLEDLVKRLEKRLQQPDVGDIVDIEPLENLFHGELGKSWEGKAVYGGDFSKFAKFEENMLLVDVPAGNSWGKTGIRTTKPLIKIPHKDANVSKKIVTTHPHSTGMFFPPHDTS